MEREASGPVAVEGEDVVLFLRFGGKADRGGNDGTWGCGLREVRGAGKKDSGMNKRRYRVPEELVAKTAGLVNEMSGGIGFTHAQYEMVLRAFAEVLAEDPIVPTVDQVVRMMGECEHNDGQLTRRIVVEWQRRMFLSPQLNGTVVRAVGAVMGSTLTRSEANEIIDAVNLCVPPPEAL